MAGPFRFRNLCITGETGERCPKIVTKPKVSAPDVDGIKYLNQYHHFPSPKSIMAGPGDPWTTTHYAVLERAWHGWNVNGAQKAVNTQDMCGGLCSKPKSSHVPRFGFTWMQQRQASPRQNTLSHRWDIYWPRCQATKPPITTLGHGNGWRWGRDCCSCIRRA